jgi:hypothetical protein
MEYKDLVQFLLAWRNKDGIALPGSVCIELAEALTPFLKEVK